MSPLANSALTSDDGFLSAQASLVLLAVLEHRQVCCHPVALRCSTYPLVFSTYPRTFPA
jgi:hypothetical protein